MKQRGSFCLEVEVEVDELTPPTSITSWQYKTEKQSRDDSCVSEESHLHREEVISNT